LADAETYANKAIGLVDKLQKQPNQTDEQFQKSKSSILGQLHGSLGLVHLQRSAEGLTGPDKDELAKAEQEYKLAVSVTDRPDPSYYFRLGEAYTSDGKLDEALGAFSKASELGQGSVLKTYADQRIQQIKARQAQSKASAKP